MSDPSRRSAGPAGILAVIDEGTIWIIRNACSILAAEAQESVSPDRGADGG